MSTVQFTSKQAFIDALESRRAFWQEYDRQRTEKHKAQENEWLLAAQAKLRKALTWSYEEFKDGHRYSYGLSLGEFPTCPILMESKIDRVLSVLGYTQAKSFRVNSEGTWAEAHKILTWDPYATETVC